MSHAERSRVPKHSAKAGIIAREETHMDTTTLLIIVLIVLLLGGGWYGRGRWY